jgi:hypothetical protein
MNERIKELRRQATLVETYTSHDGSVHEGKSVDLEKFAELIVKECLQLNKSQLVVIPKEQEDWDGHNYGFTAAVYGFEDLVKEHFGLEE